MGVYIMKAIFNINNNVVTVSIGMITINIDLNKTEETIDQVLSTMELFFPIEEAKEQIEQFRPLIQAYLSMYSLVDSASTLTLNTNTGIIDIKATMTGQINIKDISTVFNTIQNFNS